MLLLLNTKLQFCAYFPIEVFFFQVWNLVPIWRIWDPVLFWLWNPNAEEKSTTSNFFFNLVKFYNLIDFIGVNGQRVWLECLGTLIHVLNQFFDKIKSSFLNYLLECASHWRGPNEGGVPILFRIEDGQKLFFFVLVEKSD